MRPRERLAATVAVVLLSVLAVQIIGVWRDRQRQEGLRATLRRFAIAQESFRYDHRVYGVDPTELQGWGFQPADRQRIVIVEATGLGWSAIAEHTRVPTRCFLFVRDAAPVGPAQREGVIECL